MKPREVQSFTAGLVSTTALKTMPRYPSALAAARMCSARGPAGAAAGPVGVHHEAGVGDTGGGAAVVGGDVGGGDDGAGVVLGDVERVWRGFIHRARASSSDVSGSQGVGFAGGDDAVPEGPDLRPVVGRRFP